MVLKRQCGRIRNRNFERTNEVRRQDTSLLRRLYARNDRLLPSPVALPPRSLLFTLFLAFPQLHSNKEARKRKSERDRASASHLTLVHRRPPLETENRTSPRTGLSVTIAVNQAWHCQKRDHTFAQSEEAETLVGDRAVETCPVDLLEVREASGPRARDRHLRWSL